MGMFETLDWRALFDALYPGFFDAPGIRALPPDQHWEEMALPLRDFSPDAVAIPVPDGARFGLYGNDPDVLRRAVARVDADWPQFFDGKRPVYCAFDGDAIMSFCLLDDMSHFGGLRIAGPGCVGTLPEYRRRGVGLKLVQNATAMLRADGFDVSFIHYTGVAPWYARLGYRTVLRWNNTGFMEDPLP